VTFDDVDIAAEDHAELLLAVDDALDQLADFDARQAQVVECRFFGGLTEVETAEAIGVSLRTVKRDWAKARSWLYQAISPDAVE
jgi:RNA polymerase sigma factor (sigma-70 family)